MKVNGCFLVGLFLIAAGIYAPQTFLATASVFNIPSSVISFGTSSVLVVAGIAVLALGYFRSKRQNVEA